MRSEAHFSIRLDNRVAGLHPKQLMGLYNALCQGPVEFTHVVFSICQTLTMKPAFLSVAEDVAAKSLRISVAHTTHCPLGMCRYAQYCRVGRERGGVG